MVQEYATYNRLLNMAAVMEKGGDYRYVLCGSTLFFSNKFYYFY
jgi:hypothetical protein